MPENETASKKGQPEVGRPKAAKAARKRATKKRASSKKKAAPRKKTTKARAVKSSETIEDAPTEALAAVESPAQADRTETDRPPEAGEEELVDVFTFRGSLLDGTKNLVRNPSEIRKGAADLLRRIDHLIHQPLEIPRMLERDECLVDLSKFFFVVTLVTSAIYGAVMGATNLLQGSSMAFWAKLAMIVVTAIKVPLLFLLTLAIVLIPVYFSNAVLGAQLTFKKMTALLLASLAITAITLASMSTVGFFFALTTPGYDFIKVLHVVIFIYAGAVGLYFLVTYIRQVTSEAGLVTPKILFVIWLLLYMFVGTQLAWVLRPYVGSPDKNFQLFRDQKGTFYESVASSVVRMMKD